jgi:HEAT repeats
VREAIPRLAKMLAKDPEAGVRSYAPKALALFGPETIGAILSGHDDKVSYVRRDSARALGELKAVEAVPKLMRALKVRKDDDDISSAIDALADIGKPEGLYGFLFGLASRRQDERGHRCEVIRRKQNRFDRLALDHDHIRLSEMVQRGKRAHESASGWRPSPGWSASFPATEQSPATTPPQR